MEATVYQQNTVAPEGITEVEAQRMVDAIEAAAAPQKYSLMPSANFWQKPETKPSPKPFWRFGSKP